MSAGHSLLHITVSKEAAYERCPGLDARIVGHIKQWRDSVELGTTVTINKMMNCSSTCGCSTEGQSTKCAGAGPGYPVEIVLDCVFPPDGDPCRIEGVKGIADSTPKQIQRTG
jgi:hypothetical protein